MNPEPTAKVEQTKYVLLGYKFANPNHPVKQDLTPLTAAEADAVIQRRGATADVDYWEKQPERDVQPDSALGGVRPTPPAPEPTGPMSPENPSKPKLQEEPPIAPVNPPGKQPKPEPPIAPVIPAPAPTWQPEAPAPKPAFETPAKPIKQESKPAKQPEVPLHPNKQDNWGE